MSDALATWIDGVEGNLVPADDRGLQYGDGVFETIFVRRGVPRFLAAHRERLRRGLTRLGIPFPRSEILDREIARAAALAPPLAVLKIIVTRGSMSRRGYAPAGIAVPRRVVSLWPTAPLAPELLEKGATLDVSRLRLPEPSPFAGLKHLNRLENVMAAADGVGGSGFDVLLLNSDGHVVSGASCNVFIMESGRLSTPPVTRSGVAGVMRGIVLREAPRQAIAICERSFTLDEALAADAMFITNARIGVVPVKRVREHEFAMSDVVTRLRQTIEELDA